MMNIDLQGQASVETEKSLYFLCKFMDDRLPENALKKLEDRVMNLPVFWRHQNPVEDKYSHQIEYGRVVWVKSLEDSSYCIVRLHKGSSNPFADVKRKALARLIKLSIETGTQIGLSLTYQKVAEDDIYPYEVSVTPWPACKSCVINMEEDEKNKLNKLSLEELQKILEARVIELESKEKENKELNKLTETMKQEKLSLEDKVKKLEDEVATFKAENTKLIGENTELHEKIEKLEAEIVNERRKPFIEKVKKLDKDELFDDETLKTFSIEKLEELGKKLENRSETAKIKVTTMEETVKKAKSEKDMLLEKLESCDPGTEIYKYLKKQLEGIK